MDMMNFRACWTDVSAMRSPVAATSTFTSPPRIFSAARDAMAWTAEMSRTAFITPSGSFVRGWSMRTEMAIDQTPADSS